MKFLLIYVPNLRFREFSFPWHQTSIKDLLSFQNGINGAPEQYGKGIKYISVGDILNNDYITYDKIVGSIDISQETLKNYSVTYGDILFQRSSEIKDDIGRTNVYLDKDNTATFGGFVIRGKKIGDYNPSFFSFLLKSPSSRKSIVRLGAGAQHYNIGQENIKTLSFYFPNEIEQVKIANLLSKIDERIQTQSKIIDDLILQKKYIIYSLLEAIQDNEKIMLKDLLFDYNVKTTINNEYPVLSSTASGMYLQTEYFNKEAASDNTTGYKIIPRGYCTYRSMSDTGLFTFNIQNLVEKGIVSPAYPVFSANNYSNEFIILYLNNASYIKKQILELKSGGTRFALPFSTLGTLKIPKLEKEKQLSFIKTITAFERKIKNEEKILNDLHKQKNYLLNNMFI
ncbi:restriction endonuclease subunit S [uncultured Holdemanella sp.]|uniref:restriction endonuclease subunit S n=1 Tax=uncultured Holdemanella sp. TaxID=1763549 RepID=UPI0025E27C3C|nr:restriction endonuclease subunit S [uncultured Holdemanella sp.]